MKSLVRKILKEEFSDIKFQKKIWLMLDETFTQKHEILCNIELFPKDQIIDGEVLETFDITFFFKGGNRDKQDSIMNDVWNLVYEHLGSPSNLYRINVDECPKKNNR